jgi:copper chaperone CopZ
MKEFTLIVDCYNYFKDYSELFDYLYSLNGVEDVVITTDDLLAVSVKYNEKIINDDRIKLEILAFLNSLNYPVIYGFDRHMKETKLIKLNYRICCEFCFGNIIYTLIETKGIEKVESNFYQNIGKN